MINKVKKIRKKYIVLFLIFTLILITPFTYSRYTSKYTKHIVISAAQPRYTVEFNSNNGEGLIETQNFEYGTSQKLKINTFTKEGNVFLEWNTKKDGTGTSYEDEEEVKNLTNENGKTITLYAIYALEKYIHKGDITFDGENGENPYIDTGIYLFSQENINRNFVVSFEIKNRVSTNVFATIMNAMDERGYPYPGMVYRISDERYEGLAIDTSTTDNFFESYLHTSVQKVTIKRINGLFYFSINDGAYEKLLNLVSLQTPFDYPVVFGASYDGNMRPQRWFQGTLSNLKVAVMEPNIEMGSIRYNANGGTGDDILQNVFPDTTYKLIRNTYTRENYVFNEWNTEKDGSGTSYTDEQKVTNLIGSGQKLSLYAQWKKIKYTVVFDANDGIGNMEPQEFEGGIVESLNKSKFEKEGYVFLDWNTKKDGTGTSYEDEEEVENLTNENGTTITLYAIYAREKYIHKGDIIFDGTPKFDGKNYIDTNIYLFNQENIKKDFVVSFEIKQRISTDEFATIMSAIDERGDPYPGMVYRVFDELHDQLVVNASATETFNETYNPTGMQKVTLKRRNGLIYLSINDGIDVELLDAFSIQSPFNYPVVFGASYDGNMQPQRGFQGTLSNLKVAVMEPNTVIRYNANGGVGNKFSQKVLPNTTYNLMKNTFTREDYVFNGWNTEKDGSGDSYTDEQEVTNLVSTGETLSLYAQWKKYKYTVKFDSNGGIGNIMEPQEFDSGINESLNQSTYTKEGYSFAFWNTEKDGSGNSYEDQESVRNLGTEENQIVTLYAMYEKFNYKSDGDIIFDGTPKFDGKSYIDTGIYLFSRKNATKDFEISFEIKSYNNTKDYNTIISSMDESGNPYPGFVFRINDSTNEYNFEVNASQSREVEKFPSLETQKVVIKRVNGILYLKLDGLEEEQIIDYSTLSRNFYYPITIGAGLDENFHERRNFYGTISNLNITLGDLESTGEQLK